MHKDIHFKFYGFHGSDGRCHIRILQSSPEKPIVIVCTQYRNYYGTSVTNALEIISEKLFYEIVNGRIEGVQFNFEPSTYHEWHPDVNSFDRVLTKYFPMKYAKRFQEHLLNIPDTFNKIIWIERYPRNVGLIYSQETLSRVTLNSEGRPNWHYSVPESYLLQELGLNKIDLLVNDDDLDLEKVKKISELKSILIDHKNNSYLYENKEPLDNSIMFRQTRWINDLLEELPARLKINRSNIGDEKEASVDEKYIHSMISNILALKMPASDLFDRDFKISKLLGIYKSGREKECDFVIYKPQNKNIDSLIEVKRTSENNMELKAGVSQDIAKLALCSSIFRCHNYLLVCGDGAIIQEQLFDIFKDALNNQNDNFQVLVSTLNLTKEYNDYLTSRGIYNIYLRLQSFSGEDKSMVYIWKIAHDDISLDSQRPYEFTIQSI